MHTVLFSQRPSWRELLLEVLERPDQIRVLREICPGLGLDARSIQSESHLVRHGCSQICVSGARVADLQSETPGAIHHAQRMVQGVEVPHCLGEQNVPRKKGPW